MPATDKTYRYSAASGFLANAEEARLSLASDCGVSPSTSGRFLSARVLYPDVTAKGLRAVSETVAARYYVPPAMLTRILREADPVATVSPGAVRFEGFSACCSVYARMDLMPGALDVSHASNGTTNVDFGADLRGALANVGREAEFHLDIEVDGVGITRDAKTIVERKVPLPLRWIRGFSEVQVVQAQMRPFFHLPRVAAQRFLRALPRGKDDSVQWVSASGGVARLSSRLVEGAVMLRGGHRLRILETMISRSNGLEVFSAPATGASAWSLDFGSQRFWLVLNAEPWRGFSGDGGTLSGLAASSVNAVAAVRAQLNWQDRIDIATLASATGLDADTVESALAELAARGLVGFDLGQGGYFHRVLPFDLAPLDELNPRLKAAQALCDTGAVTLGQSAASVMSRDVVHTVERDGDGWRCTCAWFAKHGRQRGPCKHVLAVEMQLERSACVKTN
ncbi:SWIM zinc finger family protein [Roseibium sp.]|uniref:SWIM zinc finger family protein n=1 Tax=Roseibium sp. TaxID=1936156 RepID=UPI003BA88BC3